MTQETTLWMQNNTYSARVHRQLTRSLWSEGVLEGLAVTQKAGGTNMSVDVAVGSAVIYGDDQVNQGAYLLITTGSENHVVAAAPGSNSRIDLVCYRINDPNAGGPAGNNSEIIVVQGTSAASPVAPAVPTSAIVLAEILVASGTAAITNSMITPRREPALVSGSARPGTIVAYAGGEDNLSGDTTWEICDGGELNRETYFGLFQEIGTTYGNGNGTTTFNKPDYRGVALIGMDNMGGVAAGRVTGATTLGAVLGDQTRVLTSTELPGHTHTVSHVHTMPTHVHGMANHYHGAPSHSHTTPSHQHDIGHGHAISEGTAGNHYHGASEGGTWGLLKSSAPVFLANGIETQYGASGYWSWAAGGNPQMSKGATSTDGNHTHGTSVSPMAGLTPVGGSGTTSVYGGNTGGPSVANTDSANPGSTNNSTPTTSSTGGGGGFGIVQPSVPVNWLIRV